MNLEARWRDCPYLNDLIAQPGALAQTIAGLEGATGLEPFAGAAISGRWRRILLTGMGSSYWGCRPLYLRLLDAGLTPVMVETSELIHYERKWLTPDTLVIAVSQSGQSVETVRLLDLACGRCDIIGVTNTPDSPLATRSTAALLMHAGAEFTVSCKTYLATLLALDWLGDLLCGLSPAPLLAEARQVLEPLRAYLERWPAHVAQWIPHLHGVQSVFIVGRGTSLAAAETGGLIVKESTHTHAEGLSAAAFRHGPLELLSDAVFVLVYEGDERSAPFSRQLVTDIRKAGGRSVLASHAAEGVLLLPPCSSRLRPLMEILPVEMLTLAMAALKGRVPGHFERATKVTVIE